MIHTLKRLIFITLFAMIINTYLTAALPAFGYFPPNLITKAGSCWSDYANQSQSYSDSQIVFHYYFDYVTDPCPGRQNQYWGTADSQKITCTRKKRAKTRLTIE